MVGFRGGSYDEAVLGKIVVIGLGACGTCSERHGSDHTLAVVGR